MGNCTRKRKGTTPTHLGDYFLSRCSADCECFTVDWNTDTCSNALALRELVVAACGSEITHAHSNTLNQQKSLLDRVEALILELEFLSDTASGSQRNRYFFSRKGPADR